MLTSYRMPGWVLTWVEYQDENPVSSILLVTNSMRLFTTNDILIIVLTIEQLWVGSSSSQDSVSRSMPSNMELRVPVSATKWFLIRLLPHTKFENINSLQFYPELVNSDKIWKMGTERLLVRPCPLYTTRRDAANSRSDHRGYWLHWVPDLGPCPEKEALCSCCRSKRKKHIRSEKQSHCHWRDWRRTTWICYCSRFSGERCYLQCSRWYQCHSALGITFGSWGIEFSALVRVNDLCIDKIFAQTDNYETDIINPAVLMVTSVLDAASRVPTVRRVVLTSSCMLSSPGRSECWLTNWSGVTLIPFEWNMNPDSEKLYTGTFTISQIWSTWDLINLVHSGWN